MKKRILGLTFLISIALYFVLSPKEMPFHRAELANKYKNMEEEKEKQADRPDQAQLEEVLLRSEIGKPFSYPDNWRFAAIKQVRSRMGFAKTSAALQWQERGPSNFGGRTRSVAVHPQNDQIWWVAAVSGGIWYTEDQGEHWTCQTDDLPVLSATTLALCDSQPNILYAGTGEGFYNYGAVPGDGIFKTSDGGQTWVQLESTASNKSFRYVNRVIVHPAHPDTAFAATRVGLFRTVDGGTSWQKVFDQDSPVFQVIANPLNFNTLFLTAEARGIYRSTDMGQNWTLVSDEISDFYRIEMAIARADTNILYASPVGADNGLLGFFKSSDAGITWVDLGNSVNWLGSQGWYDNTLAVDPFDPQVVFVGGIDLYRVDTHSDPAVIEQISSWYGGDGLPYVHADQHFLVPLPEPDSSTFGLIAANDGGIFYSPDQGQTWSDKNNGYNVTQFYDVARHPLKKIYIGGTQDNGTQLSPENAHASTSWQKVIGGDGFDCAWSKSNPDVIFATLYNSYVYRSVNGGDVFVEVMNGLPASNIFHTPLEMDPHNSNKLFSATDENKIYISTDGASNWQGVDVNLDSGRWIKIAVSEKDSNIVWVAGDANHINVSTDAGYHFTTVPKPSEAPNARVTGIATSPVDSATAIVMFGVYGYGKAFITHDLGQTWQNITNNLPEMAALCALIMPYDSSEIWVGTDIGLFISYDEGGQWQYASQNLPAVAVRNMKIVGKEIVAATYGRGVWTVINDRLDELVLEVREPILYELTNHNPNTNQLQIPFKPRGQYDSLQVLVNDLPVATMFQMTAYQDTTYNYQVQPPLDARVQIIGFLNGQIYPSEIKERVFYLPVDTLTVHFDEPEIPFSGDMEIKTEEGFDNPAMHTEHPYRNQTDYIANLLPPVTISDSLMLSYRDIAVVEPGENGIFYPDYRMWDYVALEATTDGETWTPVFEPYDARYDEDWLYFYQNDMTPNGLDFRSHDTLLTDLFAVGQKAYFRFRLYADGATAGWGWAIDDVVISKHTSTGLENEPTVANTFKLLGNYPNPFGEGASLQGNPGTEIRFTLDQPREVSLTIYNSAGQKVKTLVRNKLYAPGQTQQLRWDGNNDRNKPVASGVYFYRLKADQKVAIGKMLLVR